MEHTVSDINRRPDELIRMKPGGSGDMERRHPIPGPELVLARRYAGALARLARRVDFTVHPIAVAPREAAEGGRRA